LTQIEAPALAAMLRHRLAELARLGPEEIEALIPSKAPPPKSRPAPGRALRKAVPLEAKLLSRILLRPELAAAVPDDVLRGVSAELAALREVVGYFRADPTRTLGQASAYFEGSEFQAPLEESLQDPLLQQADSPDLDIEAEVHEI